MHRCDIEVFMNSGIGPGRFAMTGRRTSDSQKGKDREPEEDTILDKRARSLRDGSDSGKSAGDGFELACDVHLNLNSCLCYF